MQAVPSQQVGTVTNPQGFPWEGFGIVMFDGNGRLLIETVRLRANTMLGDRVNKSLKNATTGAVLTLPVPPAGIDRLSTIGFALYDGAVYNSLPTGNRVTWLGENSIPFLINRYDGSLLKGQ
jgi:hypothetical protein